ncbi:nucleotide pyrophosphohydrolase [Fulvivirga kasyanovii]|uniref:nucleotide pyrophosphohydrolase n=1 Tax=Fulvivirga kasyanovii TaxID=396812 RepID=UPI0031D1D4A0
MSKIDFEHIREQIIKFREDRNWKQFHTIKDLLLGLNIELAELQELVLWKNQSEIEKVDKGKIEEELADIFIFLVYLSEHFDVDLLKAVDKKIDKNGRKYPVEKSFGNSRKYNELE